MLACLFCPTNTQKGKGIQFHMKDGNYKKLETETLHIWKKKIPVFKLINGVTAFVASLRVINTIDIQ